MWLKRRCRLPTLSPAVKGQTKIRCHFIFCLGDDMINIIFTFILTYFVMFVCWFLPKAGTPEYTDPTRKELLALAFVAAIPAAMVAIMF